MTTIKTLQADLMESNQRADALARNIQYLREQLCEQALVMANLHAKLATAESKGFHSCQTCSEHVKRHSVWIEPQSKKKHVAMNPKVNFCFLPRRESKSADADADTDVDEEHYGSLQTSSASTTRKRKVVLDSGDDSQMLISS